MSSRTLSRKANEIENMLFELENNYFLDAFLQDVGFSKQCYQRAYSYGLYTLDDIYSLDTDELKEIYEYNSNYLLTLAHNIRRVYEDPDKYLDYDDDDESDDDYDDESDDDYDDDDEDLDRTLDDILEGWNTVQEYDLDYLENMADWDCSRGHEPKEVVDVNGYLYEADSRIEIELINKLNKEGYFQELRGQNLKIEYKTKRKGKIKNYEPDLVMLNQDNYIVIVEVKPLYNIPKKLNNIKYKALGRYCKENGYLYCMCDSQLRTYGDLENFEIDENVKEAISNYLYYDGVFDSWSFEQLKKDFNYYAEDYLKEMVAATVVQCNLNFLKGDLAGGIKSLKIYKKKTSTID